MTDRRDSPAVRVLQALADAIHDHPRWFTYPQLALFAVAVWFTVTRLTVSMNRNDLVGADKKYHQNYLRFRSEFPGQDDLVAVVESEDLEKNRQFVERLGRRVESQTNFFTDVFFKGDLKMMGRKALLFVPEADLASMRQTLGDYRPFIQQFARATNLASLFHQVNVQFRTAKREQNASNESLMKALPALERMVRRAEECLGRSGVTPSPGVDALFGAGEAAERAKYITFANGRIYLVTARALSKDRSVAAVHRLRELVTETQREVPGVNVGITGEDVLQNDEMVQSQRDSTLATIVSLVIVILIFIFGYQETGRPLKATFCLLIGLGYTMGYTTLVVGHLNILTITFAPMLIGMAIDFGVHLIARYEEELRQGRTQRVAMQKAIVYTGQGIFTGCFTTAGAFFAMALTDFKGIREMGIITGGGMLICLVPMMTLLPVLLLRRGRQNQLDHQSSQAEAGRRRVEKHARRHGTEPKKAAADRRARVERLWLDRPWAVLGLTLGLTTLAVFQFHKVHFDYNLLNMQSRGLPAVEFEKKLMNAADKSLLYAAVVARSTEQAARIDEQLRRLPSVATTDTMSRYLLEDSTRKRELIGDIKLEIAGLRFAEADEGPVDIQLLSQTLFALQGYLGFAGDEVAQSGDRTLQANLASLREALASLRYAMFQGDREVNARKLGEFQRALLADIRDTFDALRNQDDTAPLRVEDLPAPLRHRFLGVSGHHLIQVYPKGDVWQREAQREFVSELRTVDPEVTGTPVQLLEYTTLLKDSYVEAAWWALGAIVLLVLIHFRSPLSVVLALLPVGIGAAWMVGVMGWFGIPFNPANIMTLPLVIGIGVTNGIHILNRFAEEKNPGILAKSTGKAVLVSGLTTLTGFGSLVLAKHQGIESLGWVMATGTATCMIAGLTFLPALLTLIGRARVRRPPPPAALRPQPAAPGP